MANVINERRSERCRNKTGKPPPKTSAERVRRFRERKRLRKEVAIEQLMALSETTVQVDDDRKNSVSENLTKNISKQSVDHIFTVSRKPKTVTERVRAFRERKKAEKRAEIQQLLALSPTELQVNDHERNCSLENITTNIAKQSTDYISTSKRRPKTSTERAREFRERKKAQKKAAIEQLLVSTSRVSQNDLHQLNSSLETVTANCAQHSFDLLWTIARKPKTSAERVCEFRGRRRAKKKSAREHLLASTPKIVQKFDHIFTVKRKPKTATERVREYRARKKAQKKAAREQQLANASSINAQDEIHQRNSSWENFITNITQKSVNCPLNLTKNTETISSLLGTQELNNSCAIKQERLSPILEGSLIGTQELNKSSRIKQECVSPTPIEFEDEISNSEMSIKIEDSLSYHLGDDDKEALEQLKAKFNSDPSENMERICSVCDKLLNKTDLNPPSSQHQEILNRIIPDKSVDEIAICKACFVSLNDNNVPMTTVHNGLKNPSETHQSSPRNILYERLTSPRIPLTQIRRLK